MQLRGKRVAILAENLYQEMELWVPYYRLKEEGAEVHVVGSGGAKGYTSKHGYPVSVDVQAEQANAAEYDAVVVPGGFAPDLMRRSPAMVKLVREAFADGKVVAAICHAGWVPAIGRYPQGQARHELFLDQGRHGERRGDVGRSGGRRRREPDHLEEARRSARLLPGDREGAREEVESA